jgi:flagellar protein FlaG
MDEVRQINTRHEFSQANIHALSSIRYNEPNRALYGGNELPVSDNVEISPAVKVKDIDRQVVHINKYLQSIQRDLHFSVDQDSGLTVIRVRDKESGELIRQIPEDVFLSLAQDLNDNKPLHLFETYE